MLVETPHTPRPIGLAPARVRLHPQSRRFAQVTAFEKYVWDELQKADADGDGTLSSKEVYAIVARCCQARGLDANRPVEQWGWPWAWW